MSADQNKVRVSEELLREINWNQVALRVTNYAMWKLRCRGWRTGNPDIVAKALSAEDIASDAIRRFLGGSLTWDQEKHPDISEFFFSVVDRLVYDLVRSPDNTSQIDVDIEEATNNNPADRQLHQMNPEEILIEEEKAQELLDDLIDSASGDKRMEEFILCFTEGLATNEEISKSMKAERNEIYNLRRKLKRKFYLKK